MFKTQNFCHVASNNRNNVKAGLFVYRTTDDLATVSTNGYFNDALIDLKLHDLIIHEAYDAADNTKVQRNVLCVTEKTLDNVGTVVIKSKWEGDIEDAIEDLEIYVNNTFVKKDGSTIMTAPLKFESGSMRGAVGPYLNGVSFWKTDSQGTITIVATLSDTQFKPTTDNTIDLGNSTHKWKTLYVGAINNGYDIAVPVTNSADTLALKSQVDDAANSGEQLYTTGVWYAKMYSATTIPAEAEVEGRNYADFSQVDGNNDPIIVVYTYTSGAWALTETITPPKNHNGYMTITSKIWDIQEQAGQQGGLVLWAHNQGTFTPYPRIVSFDSINVTGESTVDMPANPVNNQIVNKNYVDNAVAGTHYFPNLFDTKWADHEINDQSWLRADTFSWQDGTVYSDAYDHLVDDIDALWVTAWAVSIVNVGTWARYPDADQVGQAHPYAFRTRASSYTYEYVYSDVENPAVNTDYLYDGYTSGANSIGYPSFAQNERIIFMFSETIAGTTVWFYLSNDGHKICPANEESNVEAIYAATGVAWYYILDIGNRRFKLPRTKFGFNGYRDAVGKYIAPSVPNASIKFATLVNGGDIAKYSGIISSISTSGYTVYSSGQLGVYQAVYEGSLNSGNDIYQNGATVQSPATQMYLYFYVGQFSQSATEQTAGLNTALFNSKADIDAGNISSVGKKTIANWCTPDYDNGIDITSSFPYTPTADGIIRVNIGPSGTNSCGIFRNNIRLIGVSGTTQFLSDQIIVSSGDTFTKDGVGTDVYIMFYPFKANN